MITLPNTLTPNSSVLVNRLLARGKFRHLQVLLKLAELGSVHRTAEAIGMSQPTVTQMLAALEELLQVKLFERHARGVRPTAICMEMLPVARQMLLGVVESAELVVTHRVHEVGSVRLLASAAAVNGLLLEAISEFLEMTPQVQIHLREAEGDDLLLAITRGEVDLAVCRSPKVIPAGWSFEALLEDKLVAVCDPSHPLSRRRRVTWSDVKDEAWLLPPARSIARTGFVAIATRPPHLRS